jgi:pimeloyl-ACP methyl ester carboxylesterase
MAPSPGRPIGPVEASILQDLAPVFSVRAVPAGGTVFRVLEGGSGPPAVLIHGRGLASTAWAPWLLPLARTRRVIAIDLPGFGATPAGQLRPGGAEEGLEYFAEPVIRLLGALRVERPVLIGHSLGGFVSVEVSLRRAVEPEALVLIGSMGVGPAMSFASRAYFLVTPERVARLAGKGLFSRISPLPEHAWGRQMADLEHELAAVPGGRPIPTAAFNRLYPMVGPALHRLDRLGEIAAPSLLLWGEHDAAFPAPAALVAAAAMPRGRALVLPDLGHSPHLQAPEKVLAEVEAFLGQRKFG